MPRNVVVLLNSDEGRTLVRKKCRAVKLPISAFEQLVDAELDQQGKRRRAGLFEEFDQIFDEIAEEEPQS